MPVTTYKPTGEVIFDSDSHREGLCVGYLSSVSGTSVVSTFPEYPGATIKAFNTAGSAAVYATVDYALGYPRVTLPPVAGLRVVLWLTTLATPAVPETGFYISNADGALVMSPDGFGLYHAYKIIAGSGGSSWIPGVVVDGVSYNGFYRFQYLESTVGVAVVELPIDDIISVSRVEVVSGFVYIDVHIIPNSGVVPVLHIFNRAPTPSAGPQFWLKGLDEAVKWDLMRPVMLQSFAMFGLDAGGVNAPPQTYPYVPRVGIVATQGPADSRYSSPAFFGTYNYARVIRGVQVYDNLPGGSLELSFPLMYVAYYGSGSPVPYPNNPYSVPTMNLVDLSGAP